MENIPIDFFYLLNDVINEKIINETKKQNMHANMHAKMPIHFTLHNLETNIDNYKITVEHKLAYNVYNQNLNDEMLNLCIDNIYINYVPKLNTNPNDKEDSIENSGGENQNMTFFSTIIKLYNYYNNSFELKIPKNNLKNIIIHVNFNISQNFKCKNKEIFIPYLQLETKSETKSEMHLFNNGITEHNYLKHENENILSEININKITGGKSKTKKTHPQKTKKTKKKQKKTRKLKHHRS